MWSQRSVIDYGLARRATLTSLLGAGAVTREDACDAHPYLLLAARSSALFDAEPARHTMDKLEALQRHPAVPRMRFVTTVEALDTLVGAQ